MFRYGHHAFSKDKPLTLGRCVSLTLLMKISMNKFWCHTVHTNTTLRAMHTNIWYFGSIWNVIHWKIMHGKRGSCLLHKVILRDARKKSTMQLALVSIHCCLLRNQQLRPCYKYTYILNTPTHFRDSMIARFMGPTLGPPGSCRPHVDPMLAPWILLYGLLLETGILPKCRDVYEFFIYT